MNFLIRGGGSTATIGDRAHQAGIQLPHGRSRYQLFSGMNLFGKVSMRTYPKEKKWPFGKSLVTLWHQAIIYTFSADARGPNPRSWFLMVYGGTDWCNTPEDRRCECDTSEEVFKGILDVP